MIKFNIPYVNGKEMEYISSVFDRRKFSGDGEFNKQSSEFLKLETGAHEVYLTPSCTSALEMSAILAGIGPGDEVIMPSFTFVSTANAFLLRGAKIKFVDIRPDTLNIDEKLIEPAITQHTKAIVVMHYAGVACEMDEIMEIARKRNILVIEDAAQGMFAYYNKKHLGTIGDIGCISYHETKNIQCGEGGAIFINNKELIERSEVVREKGTDRTRFIRGEIDKYTWRDIGSSYLMNEISAAYLYGQLQEGKSITERRLRLWNYYFELLKENIKLESSTSPPNRRHNGHIFYIKLENESIRQRLIEFLRKNEIQTATHYVPLHTSPYGGLKTEFVGTDTYTTAESSKSLRLPIHLSLSENDIEFVCEKISDFFKFGK